jgi:hypothetical protein
MAAHYVKLLPCAVVENFDRRAISQVRRQRFPKMQKRLHSAASCVQLSIQPPAASYQLKKKICDLL